MSHHMTLNLGDATWAKNFTKVSRSDTGQEVSVGFRPRKGREFVVLLIGDVPKGQVPDVDQMLADLGYRPGPSAEVRERAAKMIRSMAEAIKGTDEYNDFELECEEAMKMADELHPESAELGDDVEDEDQPGE